MLHDPGLKIKTPGRKNMRNMNKSTNAAKSSILKVLRDAGDSFVSGKYFCETLNISRQAVWKNIQNLLDQGYEIEARKGRGYRLMKEPDEMTGTGIASLITTKKFGYIIKYFRTVDSTNTELVRRAAKGEPSWTVAVADEQTGGMGRRGRSFVSVADAGIYMSILLRPRIKPGDISGITLVAAMAICDALNDAIKENAPESQKRAGIKWPNDVLIDGKKTCGILTQMNSEADYINYVITGFGINVNNESFGEDIADVATSMYLSTGVRYDRQKITAGILDHFADLYAEFMEYGDMSPFVDRYNGMMLDMNRHVDIYGGLVEEIPAGKVRHGIARGIYKDGSLIVESDGKRERVYSGEVSVRPGKN